MKIWCVEDEQSIRELEVYSLRAVGFDAHGFEDGQAFFHALQKDRPSLVILDVMLPGMDGVDILRRLRNSPETRALPVLMATARGQEFDKVQSLDLGADDYLVKPFGIMELISRVRAILRRTRSSATREQVITMGALTLNTMTHQVTVAGEAVSLTMKEFNLLHLLMTNAGVVLTRDRLLSEVWGIAYDGETRTVDVHVRTLRAKLGISGDMVATVRGMGYKLEEKP